MPYHAEINIPPTATHDGHGRPLPTAPLARWWTPLHVLALLAGSAVLTGLAWGGGTVGRWLGRHTEEPDHATH